MVISSEKLNSYLNGTSKEWSITNGLGSFAGSTVIGCNTRKYHGLLIASLKPPLDRFMLLSKVEEYIKIKDKKTMQVKEICLSNDKCKDFIIDNTQYLKEFEFTSYPSFRYEVEDVSIEKRIVFKHKENTICIEYIVNNKSDSDISLELVPLVNFRDYHSMSKKSCFDFNTITTDYGIQIELGNLSQRQSREHSIFIKVSEECDFERTNSVFSNMTYDVEKERGLDYIEDQYIPGKFEIEIDKGCYKDIMMVCSLEDINVHNYLNIFEREEKRVLDFTKALPVKNETLKHLSLIADDFIVSDKHQTFTTIIAGYPHFADWGRDSFISLEGLLLIPGRHNEAKQLLLRYSSLVKDGIVPNTFNDSNGEILYNTVDSSLWFIEAVYKYLQYSLDMKTVLSEFYPVIKMIIYAYMDGTVNNIKMDSDFLISAGDKNTQLTWMDAKVGDTVFTPRYGKVVEINSLWYNSLKIAVYLAKQIDEEYDYFNIISNKCMESFVKKFYIEDKGYLYDTIEPYSDKLRPNQIFAVSLSFPVIEGKKAKNVVETVFKELYTPYGLRTLNKTDEEYIGMYTGDVMQRDSSYHQGTVWPFLMGPFIRSYLTINDNNKGCKKLALNLVRVLIEELNKNCINGIAEIYDGNEPHISRGCYNQAWSIAELTRCIYWCMEL